VVPRDVGLLMLWGLRPGPLLFEKNPDLVWGLIASMYIGNVLLLVLNLPLIGLWVRLLLVPPRILMPLILLFCFTGTYAVSANTFDLWVMVIFGVLGFTALRLPGRPDRAGAHPGADARDALPASADPIPRGLRHLPPAPDRGGTAHGRGPVPAPAAPVLGLASPASHGPCPGMNARVPAASRAKVRPLTARLARPVRRSHSLESLAGQPFSGTTQSI
jgi:Tripartite tricarboxylate transporter TctA family